MALDNEIRALGVEIISDIHQLTTEISNLTPEQINARAEARWAAMQHLPPSVRFELIDHYRIRYNLEYSGYYPNDLDALKALYLALCEKAAISPRRLEPESRPGWPSKGERLAEWRKLFPDVSGQEN